MAIDLTSLHTEIQTLRLSVNESSVSPETVGFIFNHVKEILHDLDTEPIDSVRIGSKVIEPQHISESLWGKIIDLMPKVDDAPLTTSGIADNAITDAKLADKSVLRRHIHDTLWNEILASGTLQDVTIRFETETI